MDRNTSQLAEMEDVSKNYLLDFNWFSSTVDIKLYILGPDHPSTRRYEGEGNSASDHDDVSLIQA